MATSDSPSGVAVTFLGSGDAFGSGGRLQTCMLLSSHAGRLLIDCGASSLVAIKRAGLDPNAIDAILLSHLHGDHFGGIPFLILEGQFSRRERPLLIAGPPGLEARIRAAQEVFFPGSSGTPQRFDIRFLELSPETPVATGAAMVTSYPVEHASGAPSYALRVALDGRTVAYSGDTAWTDTLLRAADRADLFIAEAYYYDKRVPFHLDHATLLAHRAAFTCRRLILTHMSADMLVHQAEAAWECAHDGLKVVL